MVSSNLALVLVASLASTALGYPTYIAKIPNGKAFGESIGHGGGSYTPFGTLFSEKGKTWTGVCNEKWSGQTALTVGSVLGDPCCKWTGGTPDFVLTAPNLAGAVCPTAAAPTSGTAAAPAASPPILIARAPIVASFDKLTSAPARAPAPVPMPVANRVNTTASAKQEVLCEAA